jgi:hypothetical protein
VHQFEFFYGLDIGCRRRFARVMITCKVYTEYPSGFLGDLKFATLPMIGHQVFLPSNEHHRIEQIWHQPHETVQKIILIVGPAEKA